MIEDFTPANQIIHDFIQSLLTNTTTANQCFEQVKKQLVIEKGSNYVKKSSMLGERYIKDTRKEVPVFYKINPYPDRTIDVLWHLNDKRNNTNIYTVDWHCIYHEIKTGSIDIEGICKKYLGKHSKTDKNVGTTDSPLWIWGYKKQIEEAQKYILQPYILGKIKNSSIRFVPIEWIMPVMHNAYSFSGIGILGGEA